MNDKAWAMFSLTTLLSVLGFTAGMCGEHGVAGACGGGAFCTGLLTWAMTTY
ncbi:hypothetical protein phiPsa374_134 [Pseudomonas phage phiPsa374]|uniref:Uncharacterized protein n=4 Tax=Otagovirus TaxID=2560197 RepID=A0A7G9V2N2_9CAUD|nr:hypothetical protein CF96_gp086 [Pseudomonas phage phiPsa374]YP_010767229.1 hypothetical protein QGX16_gp086 [Pseudomonas phage phiPsa397]YP_010767399.1 hypothetical protein QGX17_gp088 [Pseudomonas phage phiPsa381]YP_010767574.1 hypothetical protein QGX18_gp090 [Pseudomonas phage phiPsa347]AHJ87394.1 hypothetical protein phiPsa374_134 [Pseudomonas phage phiPsa374]QNO00538.1 hypothetical protein phiPsa347_138 [Pseudomonas phage phiPsa347]QNO00706.1 hypothetical protein phiPsa381_136 [Pseud